MVRLRTEDERAARTKREDEMSTIERNLWKSALVVEFEKLYEVSIVSLGDEIGADQLDDLLNLQFAFQPSDPMLGAQKVKQVLAESFGIDVAGLSLQAEVARATGKWPRVNEDRLSRPHRNSRLRRARRDSPRCF
jgi:hypothetical protein